MRQRAVLLSLPRLHRSLCGVLPSLAHDVRAAVCRVQAACVSGGTLEWSLGCGVGRIVQLRVSLTIIWSQVGLQTPSSTKTLDSRPHGHLSSLIHDNENGYSDMTTDRARVQLSPKQGQQRAQRPRIEQVARLQLDPPSASSAIRISASSFLRAMAWHRSEAK